MEERFHSTDKSLVGTLMAQLTTMKIDRSRSMQEHTIKITNIAARLKTLGIVVDDSFLIQFILNSLLSEFGVFQINCNTIKDKWDVNKLTKKLIQEENKLKNMESYTINLMVQGANRSLKPKSKKFKKKRHTKASQTRKMEHKSDICYFYKKEGHYQKDYLKRKAWFEKKCAFKSYVYTFESYLIDVSNNTWWLNSGATTYVSNVMLRFLTIQTTSQSEDYQYMGNHMKDEIKSIGTYHFVLDIIYHLDLFKTLYVLSISRNLVSLPKLDICDFNFTV